MEPKEQSWEAWLIELKRSDIMPILRNGAKVGDLKFAFDMEIINYEINKKNQEKIGKVLGIFRERELAFKSKDPKEDCLGEDLCCDNIYEHIIVGIKDTITGKTFKNFIIS